MIGSPLPELSVAAQERVERLRERSETLREGAFWERRLHWAESHVETVGEPEVLRTAKAFAHLLDEVTVQIGEGELIVGRHPKGDPPPDMQARIDEANRAWGGHRLGEWAMAQIPPDARRLWSENVFGTGSKTGHMTPDHQGLLRDGLDATCERIDERLNEVDTGHPAAGAQIVFLQAAKIACEGASRFALRYAQCAETMAAGEDCAERRDELTRIARVCRQVAHGPARNFQEALQLAWFLHLWVCLENGEAAGAFAPGRVDQYFYPYFRADVDSGRLSEEQAYELLLCFWLKFGEIGYQAVQSVVLGGTTPDGADGTNRLTQLCLAATKQLQTIEPALVLRVRPDTPREVLRQATGVLQTGIGLPQFYNDAVAIRCIERAGCETRHARDYCIGGCVELTVQGMSDPWVGNFFNLPKCLLLALNEGACPLSGERIGAATPPAEELTSFEALMAAYDEQVTFCLRRMVYCENVFDRAQAQCTPYPFLSANIQGCIETATDLSAGGARYNFTEVQGVGLANAADSLAALRQFVFEEKRVSLPCFVQVLRDDFCGAEDLRMALLHEAPKYGNCDPAADELAKRVVDEFVAEVERYENPRGGRFRAGLLVWDRADDFGQATGATPDGRRARTVLADSIGPAQGRDREGPTRVVRSSTCFDHANIVGGLVLNMKFMPSTLSGDEAPEKFIDLLRSYFEMGGMQMQVNVVDDALLRAAQEQPELYQDLVVRVSGWSAKFLRLPRRLQDEVISRTAQRL